MQLEPALCFRIGSRRSPRWLMLFLAGAVTACGAAAERHPSLPTDVGRGMPAPESPPRMESAAGAVADEGLQQGAPAPAQPVVGAPTERAASPTTPTPVEDPELAAAKRMVDIEAHLRLEVTSVAEAAPRLRELVHRSEGQVASETLTEDTPQAARAEFTLRVPVGKAEDVFRALDTLGVMRARDVRTRDLGTDYYDAVVRLRNLKVTRERLEQVLKQASAVNDILTIERELTRVRGEMEQIEGQMRYMRDRAAFATIFVSLFTRQTAVLVQEVLVKPQAKFFPGLHGGLLLDLRPNASTAGYYGGGFGVGLSRHFDLSVDGFRRLDHAEGTLDAFAATLGGRFYSEYLGGGARRFFEPYLGLRGGYSRFEGRNEIATGVTLGLELFKSETVRLDSSVQAFALFGSSAGAHAALIPTLGVDVAF